MRKIILATALLILGTAGAASADRYRGRDGRDNRTVVRDNRGGRTVVRDNRGYDNRNYNNRVVVRDRRWNNDAGWRNRRPVYVNNNRYTFANGHTFYYRRPEIRYHYYNYRIRPSILVENYDTVPGYVWVAGNWNWNGYEWLWVSGHYEIDANYDGLGDQSEGLGY
jgi:hypothetical protein